MSMIARRMTAHRVSVQTRTSVGSFGPEFATAKTKSCYVQDVSKLVRDAKGEEIVSTTTLFAPLTDQAVYPIGSLVTLPSGRETQVIQVSILDAGPFSHGLQHVAVYLS